MNSRTAGSRVGSAVAAGSARIPSRLVSPAVERSREEIADRTDDVQYALTQGRVDIVGDGLDTRGQAVRSSVEVERDQRERNDDEDDDRQCAARSPGPGHPGEIRYVSEW